MDAAHLRLNGTLPQQRDESIDAADHADGDACVIGSLCRHLQQPRPCALTHELRLRA